jgi:hypothetical protein
MRFSGSLPFVDGSYVLIDTLNRTIVRGLGGGQIILERAEQRLVRNLKIRYFVCVLAAGIWISAITPILCKRLIVYRHSFFERGEQILFSHRFGIRADQFFVVRQPFYVSLIHGNHLIYGIVLVFVSECSATL